VTALVGNDVPNLLDNEAIRNSRFTSEGDNFVWFKGGNIISIVNTNTFESTDINLGIGK